MNRYSWVVRMIPWLLLGVIFFFVVSSYANPCSPSTSSYVVTFFNYLVPCAPPPPSSPSAKATTKDASLALTLESGSIRTHGIFTVDLYLRPSQTPVNLVYALLSYPTSVALLAQDTHMSPFALRLADPDAADAARETIQMQPSPGIMQPVRVAAFTFEATRPGTFFITIASSSHVLANDGFGTDILGTIQGVSVTVTP